MKAFTKKLILSLAAVLLLTTFSAFAGNITIGTKGSSVGAVDVGNQTWTTGSTVTVYDHMIIPVGKSLTIQEGVNVQIADTTLKIEMIVLGNLYFKGTAANPINFGVLPSLVPATVSTTKPFPGLWGSIVCDTTCTELLMLHTNIKYYGAATTNNSPSVLLHLYKNAAGQTEPYLNFRNHNNGKMVVEYCTFSNGMDDGTYIEGGNVIYAYNTTYQNGSTGGDAVDIKAGTIGDLSYNLFYSQNTSGFKVSNTGSRSPQCNVVMYNNTIVNSGWRRPTVKGGSVWYEAGVVAKTYNTLFLNDRFGIKTDGAADPASTADYNYYYGFGQDCVNNFNAPTAGLFPNGTHDILGATAGTNDPLLVNYPLSTDIMNSKFDPTWDFHLQNTSPVIGKGTTNITRHFGTAGSGITIAGVEYLSPTPSTTIGAFPQSITGLVSVTENKFEIYPIPAIDVLNIKLKAIPTASTVEVYSLLGTKMFEKTINEGTENVSITVANLTSGIYYVSLKNGDNYSVQKFVKK